MQRRAFLALPPLLAAAGCDVPAKPLPVEFGGMPPWHMWGSTERLTIAGNGEIQSRQLAKINYKRPETWSMFFAAKVISAAVAAPSLTLEVNFEIILGVGRTSFDTSGGFRLATTGDRAFVYMRFDLPMPYVPSTFGLKYTNVAHGPPLDDSAPTVRPTLEWFPASDIQCQAGARATPSANANAIIEVTSYFAPRTHMRPDWFQDLPRDQFGGGEIKGT